MLFTKAASANCTAYELCPKFNLQALVSRIIYCDEEHMTAQLCILGLVEIVNSGTHAELI